MGLDMYAYTRKTKPERDVDFRADDSDTKIHYWRKHPDLHGWMQALYFAKGGKNPEFNLATLVLTSADLAALEAAIIAGGLPETSGFLFGQSDGEERADDLAFVETARAAIADGMTVFYVAWW